MQPYRDNDLADECERLRARIRELEEPAWTDEQLKASREMVGGASFVLALVLVMIGSAWILDHDPRTGGGQLASPDDIVVGVCFLVASVPFVWVLLRLSTGHWDWWRGIFVRKAG